MRELKNDIKPMIVVALWDELIFICPFYICGTHRGKRKHLHMVFIYLEKAYDRVLRKVRLLVLEKKKLPKKYIDEIKDMHDEAKMYGLRLLSIHMNFNPSLGFTIGFITTLFLAMNDFRNHASQHKS